ncbi:MAG: FUSC family protein [Clostridia bacterium]|nr:FUSC family protein [Clostridia bacterium]MBP3588143.1 FUSC family protein [Clostridia bacterium]
MEQKKSWIKFPKVGMRTVKTVISATLVAIVYGLINDYTSLSVNPCFACIGAVFGMGNVWKGGLQSGGNRFIGTLIGGLVVIPVYWLTHLSGLPVPEWIWVALGLFLVLYAHQMFGANGAIQPGAVVFFVVMDTVIPERYISYTIARIIDTGIGVLVSLVINHIWPSPLEAKPEQEAVPAESAK